MTTQQILDEIALILADAESEFPESAYDRLSQLEDRIRPELAPAKKEKPCSAPEAQSVSAADAPREPTEEAAPRADT